MLRRPKSRVAIVLIGTIVFSFFLSVGCGSTKDKPQPVSGKVTSQGKPVGAGMIRLSNPAAGVDIMAPLQQDGTYEVIMAKGTGLPVGVYQVAVMPPRVDSPLGPMKERPKPQNPPDIPPKYRDPATSGVMLKVQAGDNHFDVDMKP